MIKSVRDADSNALPQIIREIRSTGDDVQYYAPLGKAGSPEARVGNRTGFANDATGSPLVELGKIMGTLQLQEGQVRIPHAIQLIDRFDTLDQRQTCLLSQQSRLQHNLPSLHLRIHL